ncbi:MAG TPA: enolase C-terminal domain-like protein [Rhodocyclaceae bacterium]|nr:enolase C-terminal domain-like protein [Rhodocyclaceae bacterium]
MAESGKYAAVESVRIAAYSIPTDAPESDGTLVWNATTLLVARIRAAGIDGLGYGYADTATARLIADKLGPLLIGMDAFDIPACWIAMQRAIRNLGRQGIAAMAISVLDIALWDLKARCLDASLVTLLGRVRDCIPAYGSGGFTSYDDVHLRAQLSGWAEVGLHAVKMKVGRDSARDHARVIFAREAVGSGVELFVDANGAYTRKQALMLAEQFAVQGVRWFEEPVSSDDLEGLRLLRDRAPVGMDIAAGEYGYESNYFSRMLSAGAVDVLQADATRCGGITGFLQADALCISHCTPLSSHCAPALHVALCCAAQSVMHLEYFHDHVRIENMLFDGVPQLVDGSLAPQTARPGLGLDFKEQDATCFQVM